VNRPRRAGTAWETAVARFLRDRGFPADRSPLRGARDEGDVTGIPGWVIECKAQRTWDLAGWCDEAAREAANAAARAGAYVHRWAVVVKRFRRSVGDAYVVVDLDTFAELLRLAGFHRRALIEEWAETAFEELEEG
jgi:Holliday junction resolvase